MVGIPPFFNSLYSIKIGVPLDKAHLCLILKTSQTTIIGRWKAASNIIVVDGMPLI